MTTRKLVAVIAAVALAILVIPLVWMAFFGWGWGMMGSGQGMYNNGGGWGMMGSGQGMYNNGNGGNNNDNGMMSNNGAMSDRAFVEMMIPHHQGAIEMADVALAQSKRPEIRALATEIIAAQQAEIKQMETWRDAWPNDNGQAMPHEMGMMNAMDMDSFRNAEDVDRAFIDAMIPHHQGAVMMSGLLLATTDRPELVTFAKAIIAAQESEIAQMRQWRLDWYGK